MDEKETYETASAIADALPESEREMFASLMDSLSRPTAEYRHVSRTVGVRRWLRDAGWIKR